MIEILTSLAITILALTTPFLALYCAFELIWRFPSRAWAIAIMSALLLSWAATGAWFQARAAEREPEPRTVHLEIIKALLEHEIERLENAKKD